MRLGLNLLIIVLALALCAGVYFATGGRLVLFLLPLVFALPLLRRR